AKAELQEAELLAAYLPAQLSEAQVMAVIEQTVAQLGASGPADMGKVMGAVKPKLAGKADMSKVSGQVKSVLSAL
ncbi:MAG: GatB/YqeY domain-containing protein, partial [Limnobacter sp.]|nr:GatB/YqeY domain-containing protein [Limnobacter sp.]